MEKHKLILENVNNSDLESYKAQLFDYVKNDAILMSYLKSHNVTEQFIKDNIGLISEYKKAQAEIEECNKAGKCLQENHLHGKELSINGQFISLITVACPAFITATKNLSKFVYADFPQSYLSLDASDYSKRKAFLAYFQEIKKIQDGEINNLYVYGKKGIGKLVNAYLNMKNLALSTSNYTFGVVNYPKLVRKYSSNFYETKSELENELPRLVNIDFLIIDEFGNEETNKLLRESITFPLINERISKGKKTIFISELSLDELLLIYDPYRKDVRARQIINLIKGNITKEIYVAGTKI